MRQLYYTIRYLLRGRGGNVIKVLSLTLGLGVGLILFARVAFELSFDTFFDQVEDLYSVHVRYNDDKTGEEDGSRILFAPIPEALRQEFPEIQYATVCRRRYGAVLYHGEDRFKPRLMMADSLFFTEGFRLFQFSFWKRTGHSCNRDTFIAQYVMGSFQQECGVHTA